MNPFSNQIKDIFPDTVSIREERNSALEKLSETEFPSPEQEIWRYSKIFDLDLESLKPSFSSPDDKKTESSFLDTKDLSLVSINDGWLGSPKGSNFLDSSQVYLGSLADMGKEFAHIEENFNKPKDFFDCLNRSYNPETLVIHVPDGVALESPIYIKIQLHIMGN